MKVYTYSRVSTDKQDNSLDLQQKKLIEFCERKGFTNVIHLSDSDVSGGKALYSRPEGSKLKDLQKGDVLITYKSDRLYRSFRNAVNTTIDLVDKGVKLYIINFNEEPISFENYMLEAMLYQTFIFAHLEKRQIGQRTKDGLHNRRVNGKTNSAPKFGYTNVGKGKDGVEVVNENEIKAIRRMNELRQSHSAYVVAKMLNSEGFLTKKGRGWQGSNIDTMLRRSKERGLI